MVHVSPIIAYYLSCLRTTFEDISLKKIYTGRLECTLHLNKARFLLKTPNISFKKQHMGLVFALCGGSPTLLWHRAVAPAGTGCSSPDQESFRGIWLSHQWVKLLVTNPNKREAALWHFWRENRGVNLQIGDKSSCQGLNFVQVLHLVCCGCLSCPLLRRDSVHYYAQIN